MRAKGKFNRRSILLKGFDYSKPATYYVTVCARNLEFLFGEIRRGVLYPSKGGEYVIECWNAIPKHYPHTRLHSFVLMPNHLHGILEIMKADDDFQDKCFELTQPTIEGIAWAQDVEPLPNPQLLGFYKNNDLEDVPIRKNEFQHSIPGSLGSIIRSFEIGVTKWFRHHTNVHHVWQRNFYDSIIRTEAGYNRISTCIKNNRKNWTRDKFFKRPD